jgi:hypothetical protein
VIIILQHTHTYTHTEEYISAKEKLSLAPKMGDTGTITESLILQINSYDLIFITVNNILALVYHQFS